MYENKYKQNVNILLLKIYFICNAFEITSSAVLNYDTKYIIILNFSYSLIPLSI